MCNPYKSCFPQKNFSWKRKKMVNDYHLFSITCYNVTMLKQDYYSEFFFFFQQKINFSLFELCLPDDDPVYTLKKVMEEFRFFWLVSQLFRSRKNRVQSNYDVCCSYLRKHAWDKNCWPYCGIMRKKPCIYLAYQRTENQKGYLLWV